MEIEREFSAGALVNVRNRDWIVLPSKDEDILLLKPLGGSDEEITGIYMPLKIKEDKPVSTSFADPTINDIGDFETAKLLFDASRLSFRNAAGPFRALAKLSFRPRSYQMVPLIMALKQAPVRMLIADDVGTGKTVEALLIVKELLDRGEIKRFAVVCLPHLCEQWQEELKNKFGIEAEIIRSSTIAKLDRQIRGDTNIFRRFPFQVISIDFIKSDQRRQTFIHHAPEMILVDEAHTCAKPAGAKRTQQQRYSLLHDISQKPDQQLILLTATPHSGKQEEFQSLLGLLKPQFENIEITHATPEQRKEIAKHFVQRRREDVKRWLGEDTPFPNRFSEELPYNLGSSYTNIFTEVLNYARGLTAETAAHRGIQKLKYWSALALLRGVMSSPAAGAEMLRRKAEARADENHFEILDQDDEINPVLDDDFDVQDDHSPFNILEQTGTQSDDAKLLTDLANRLSKLTTTKEDKKAGEAYLKVYEWLSQNHNPIIFCRYIATANYLGKLFSSELKKKFPDLNIEVITSELADEQRKEKILEMQSSPRRLLIATDCLSEGINLQDGFTAILHYDLPWNPNRLEQREGRIDRFGQKSSEVKTTLLYGNNNPIDGVVLRVLIRKAKEIRSSIGISIPFPEDSRTIMDAVMGAVLLNPKIALNVSQLNLDFGDSEIVRDKEVQIGKTFELAMNREVASRSIFAQNAIKADEIEEDLKETDEAIGDVKAVENFTVNALQFLGVQVDKYKKGYKLFTTNLPTKLSRLFPDKKELHIIFQSPSPDGFKYIGRNHPLVEGLCSFIISNTINRVNNYRAARASVIRSKAVTTKTTLIQFRVRNVISEYKKKNEIVAEEMILWGYKGAPKDNNWLSPEEAKLLLTTAVPSTNLSLEEQEYWFQDEVEILKDVKDEKDHLAIERAKHLVEAHERFRKVVSGKKYDPVEPILPMDTMGIYILLPELT